MKDRIAQLLLPPRDFRDVDTLIRGRIRDMLEVILEEEISCALGAESHERVPDRRGYRHGTRPPRKIVTSCGPIEVSLPRARVRDGEKTKEFESQLLRRYERRTRRVDAALITSYLAGANTRKVKVALRPLLDGTALSSSAVSRLVKRLQALFEAWRTRDLSEERYPIVILDAMRVPVRLARRVVKVPVQVVVGVREDGERDVIDMRVAPSESVKSWEGVIEGLLERNLPAPGMVLLDGNPGLIRAVREGWPEARVQRCGKHKEENLLSKAPKHCHEELKRDYRAITHAENRESAEKAYEAFCRKWEKLVPEVVTSLKEAGSDLLTFYDFPEEMWKSLRTTNAIERLNEEFRRRVKTQGSFPTEGSALTLFFGLLASGVIRLRKIDGYQHLAAFLAQQEAKLA